MALDWLGVVLKDWRQMPLAVLASVLGVAVYLHFQPPRMDPWTGTNDRETMKANEERRDHDLDTLRVELQKWVLDIRNSAVRDRNAYIEAAIGKERGNIVRELSNIMENEHASMWELGDVVHSNYLLKGQEWTRDYIQQNVPPPEIRAKIKYLEDRVHYLDTRCNIFDNVLKSGDQKWPEQ